MDRETPWYLRQPTEEERLRYNTDPWAGTPDHLRPRFLPSEFELAAAGSAKEKAPED